MKPRILPLVLLLQGAALTAHAMDDPLPTKYICVSADPIEAEQVPKTALEMLEFVNSTLDAAAVLEFHGEEAKFGSMLSIEPKIRVLARHNNVSVLERGFIMDGGARMRCVSRSIIRHLRLDVSSSFSGRSVVNKLSSGVGILYSQVVCPIPHNNIQRPARTDN